MNRILEFVCRRAGLVLVSTVVATGLAGLALVDPRSGATRVEVDASADRLLPDASEARKFYDHVQRLFGSDNTLLIALVSEDVFSAESLERIVRMTERIEQLHSVHHVLSLANAVNLRGVEGGLEIAPFLVDLPEDARGRQALRREVEDNPIFGGNLVSRDARATALVVYFVEMTDREYRERGVNGEIVAIAEAEAGGADVWISGGRHIQVESGKILLREAGWIPLLMLGALSLVLILSFRTLRGVVVPLLTIAVAVSWTLAVMVAVGHSLNAVTSLLPAVLTTLGLSYSVHVLTEYYEAHREGAQSGRELVMGTLQRVALPVALTGLTTAAGFASFALSPLLAVREFGLFAVVGVLFTVVASLSLTPAILVLLPPPRRIPSSGASGPFARTTAAIARFDLANRRPIFLAAFVVFLAALLGAREIRIGTEQITKFRPDHPVRLHFEAVNESLEGANPFYVVLETNYPEGFKEPLNLQQIEELQGWLEDQPEIGGTTSLVDYLKLINRGFHENDPSHLAIPETKRLVSQLLFFGSSEELDGFVDSRFQTTSIQVRARVVDSDDVAALIARIEDRLGQLPDHLRPRVTGTSVVFNRAMDEIIRGQATSVLAALGIIYLILAGMFVSLRIGFIALIPNVLPIVVYFGALGWFGVSLSPGTSLIAPMVLGIAVDDTIHYFARFIREAKRLGDERRATVSALQAVGRPVTYTSLALCLGFLMLLGSEFHTNGQLGVMAAFSLAFAWLTDFVLTPALCARLRIATLWDMLTIDLGREPQHSIPLFHGLTAAQARIVALMSSILEVPAGQRLIRAGEEGHSLFVVLDGTLRAAVEGENGLIELARHQRGEVIGEVGLFNQKRSAHVDVLEDARLLRVNQDCVERLARRYPKTATVVFRNLNEILARRLAGATQRLRQPS